MIQVGILYVSQQKHLLLVGWDTELITTPINSVLIICFLFIYLTMLNDQGWHSHFTQESAVRQRVRNEQYFIRHYICESVTHECCCHHVSHVAGDTVTKLKRVFGVRSESAVKVIRTSRAETRKLSGEANKCLLSLEMCSGVLLPVDRWSRSWVST
jgi:hypothetical protein